MLRGQQTRGRPTGRTLTKRLYHGGQFSRMCAGPSVSFAFMQSSKSHVWSMSIIKFCGVKEWVDSLHSLCFLHPGEKDLSWWNPQLGVEDGHVIRENQLLRDSWCRQHWSLLLNPVINMKAGSWNKWFSDFNPGLLRGGNWVLSAGPHTTYLFSTQQLAS